MFIQADGDVVPVVNDVAQLLLTSHLFPSHDVEASRLNKSHMVYYYGLPPLRHKPLNCPALTRCCPSITLLWQTEKNSLTASAWKRGDINFKENEQFHSSKCYCDW